jgi:hypothetical protein
MRFLDKIRVGENVVAVCFAEAIDDTLSPISQLRAPLDAA